jgi:type IV secretory pathway VirB3-like protein
LYDSASEASRASCLTSPFAALTRTTTLLGVPKFWIWTQVAIVVFVLAGMIIAIVKMA